ncbi:hypothetical protein ASC77_10745 [Nocardioides sp. Root1257]|uniref:hypothetical protein n=1 Tax=unclassified Nocardioides TaxID=2615069 RepID=UPI0006F5913A|nr:MULTISPECIES: hypothetical protein [unclassified Nocardioides]KQW49163.1 hypothetical protein ASC77_10745 [Nocardioides sp. Root1257]KRC48337.1 hypothetical protein ASE24_10750 [Nocardioides sp. Root224]
MTGPEDLLTRTLHERVDHRTVPATPMSDVVSAAGRIRRRHRVRYAAVATVVVAVLATPFVIDAARQVRSSTGPVDRPGPTPAPHFRLADVALGTAPSVPWLDGNVYVAADGTRTRLPIRNVLTATPYRGGFLVVGGNGPRLTLLDSQLDEVWQRCGQPRLVVDHDRTRTAYAAGDCRSTRTTLTLGPTDGVGEEQTETMPLALADPVGILGGRVVTSSPVEEQPKLVDFDGTPTPIGTLAYASAVDEHGGLVAGQLAGGARAQATGVVLDVTSGAEKWRAPGWQLLSFSPDGSLVVGASTSVDQGGWAVFDSATGKRLHEFALPVGLKFSGIAWEDDDHLLLAAFQDRTEAILRTTLDGAVQLASKATSWDPSGGGTTVHLAP